MSRVTATFDQLLRRPTGRRGGRPPVRPRGWARRHWLVLTVPVVLLAGAGIYWWAPWQPCPDGMTQGTSSSACVGLDVNSVAFRDNDPLAGLENTIASRNQGATGTIKTIVLLEDLTPEADADSVPYRFVVHDVEGAITAAWPNGEPSNIRLLLANAGSGFVDWSPAVDAIIRDVASQHIVAVTGIGQSLNNSRSAVAALSAAGIAVIGAEVTADDMNVSPASGRHSDNFLRVGPTNSDEAAAAAHYIATRGFRHIMLVQDTAASDSYATTLAQEFQKQTKISTDATEQFNSHPGEATGESRNDLLQPLFQQMHASICAEGPDLIYFAGRGTDLGSFLTSLAGDGACQGVGPITILTGDDADNLIGSHMPLSGDIKAKVFYTGLAYPNEWQDQPLAQAYETNYTDFANEFKGANHFPGADLADGIAMMEHDAVTAVITSLRTHPTITVETMPDYLKDMDCHTAVAGATGYIAFQRGTGNQIDKALPLLSLDANGNVQAADLVWSQGHPLDQSARCSSS